MCSDALTHPFGGPLCGEKRECQRVIFSRRSLETSAYRFRLCPLKVHSAPTVKQFSHGPTGVCDAGSRIRVHLHLLLRQLRRSENGGV